MENYQIVRKMANALYGDVVLARVAASEDKVAIKRMHTKCANRQVTQRGSHRIHEDATKEIEVNKILSRAGGHRNVLRMRETFTQEKQMHLVFDYCSKGELFGLIQAAGSFDERRALRYTRQILAGLQHMHRNGFAHRDLSLENVLVNDQDECQVCDFGLVAALGQNRNECVGKPMYMAPEIHSQQMYDPSAADMWSLGIILFILLTGIPPFDEAIMTDKCFRVARQYGIEKLIRVWNLKTFNDDSLDLIKGLLQVDPSKRMTLKEALAHPAFEQVVVTVPECPVIVAQFDDLPEYSLTNDFSLTMNIRTPQVCITRTEKTKKKKGLSRFMQLFTRKHKAESCHQQHLRMVNFTTVRH